jgi:hypothetical protein
MLYRAHRGSFRVTTATDEFYRDIIEGLAIHSGSAFQSDVLATISRHHAQDLGAAFNKNQMASKLWLRESLLEAGGPAYANVTILGGWFGVLAAVLLHDPRFSIGRITSVDIDPRCEAIARSVNATHVRTGRFAARTADMFDLDYGPPIASVADPRTADLVINTSCEHLADSDAGGTGYRRGSSSCFSRTTISPATSTSTVCPTSPPSAARRRCAS